MRHEYVVKSPLSPKWIFQSFSVFVSNIHNWTACSSFKQYQAPVLMKIVEMICKCADFNRPKEFFKCFWHVMRAHRNEVFIWQDLITWVRDKEEKEKFRSNYISWIHERYHILCLLSCSWSWWSIESVPIAWIDWKILGKVLFFLP